MSTLGGWMVPRGLVTISMVMSSLLDVTVTALLSTANIDINIDRNIRRTI